LVANRYRLLEKIGQGGMGAVYRAEDRLNRSIVALKRVELPFAVGAEPPSDSRYATQLLSHGKGNAQSALVNEFRTLASLRHPHIVSVLDYGFESDGTPFFTMELLESPVPLVRAAKQCDLNGKVSLLLELLQALVYLHRHAIVHHDLKPSNVLVDSSGHVRVVDFGLALRTQLTTRRAGTLAYMAPEVITGGVATEATDLYSFGVLAYECLCGHRPFLMRNTSQLRRDILKKKPDFTRFDDGQNAPILPTIERLLTKDPSLRPNDAKAVILDLCNAVGMPSPEETHDIRNSFLQTAPMVGRDAELAQLERALENTKLGQGAVCLVTGETGVGKTRLMDELRIRAMLSGIHVVRGQGQLDSALTLHLWQEVILALLLITEVSDAEASVLKAIVPTIADLLERPIPDLPMLDPQSQRERLLAVIVALFTRQTRPLLVLLDNLQWAISELSILTALVKPLRRLPVLIVSSYRRDEQPRLHERFSGEALLIRLKRLSNADVKTLSAAMLGDAANRPELQHLLTQETQGNALFVIEMLRLLANDVGQLERIGQKELPERMMLEGVTRLIWRRLTRLSPIDRMRLNMAAVHGHFVDLRLMAAGNSIKEIAEWVGRCVDASLLAITDGRCHFEHNKVREAVLRNIPQTVLPVLHEQIAIALEGEYPGNSLHAADIAAHWQAAGHLAKAIPHRLLEAERLITLGDGARAEEVLNTLLTQAQERGIALSDAVQMRMYFLLGFALDQPPFRGTVRPQAIGWFERSLSLAETLQDEMILAHTSVKLGRLVAIVLGDLDRARTLLQSAQHFFEGTHDARGLGDVYVGYGIIASNTQQFEESIDHFERALNLYQEDDYRLGMTSTLLYLSNAAYGLDRVDHAVHYAQQALALSEKAQDFVLVAGAYMVMANALMAQQEWDQALAHLEQASSLLDATESPRRKTTIWTLRGQIYAAQSDFERAHHALREALTMVQQAGLERGTATLYADLANTEVELKRFKDARQSLYRWLTAAQKFGIRTMPHGVIALCKLAIRENQLDMAAEWIGMIQDIDAAPLQRQVTPLVNALAQMPEADSLAAAMAKGRSASLEADVPRMLRFIQEKLDPFSTY
jgi:tetratricopeptide (TPR) repeat protein